MAPRTRQEDETWHHLNFAHGVASDRSHRTLKEMLYSWEATGGSNGL